MMGSPVMRFFAMAIWLINALVAINVGLLPFGYDFLNTGFLSRFADPLHYVILVAGILSLLMFFMCSAKCGCCHGEPHDGQHMH